MTKNIRDRQGRAPKRTPFAPIEDAVAAFRAGQMIIVVDDEDRENEGDLTIAAEKVTPEAINFMAQLRPRADLPVDDAGAARRARDSADGRRRTPRAFETAFCVPIEAKGARPPASPPPIARRRCWRRSIRRPGRPISRGPGTCSRCARATAACWCAPARPKRRSISRASPASIRPASSAKS